VVKRVVDATVRHARRVIVAVVGGTVVLIGIVMLVLPGPALVVIPVGLGILSLEFAWARRWLHRVREHAESAVNGFRRSGRRRADTGTGAPATGAADGDAPSDVRSGDPTP